MRAWTGAAGRDHQDMARPRHDVALVISDLGAGGAQRVLTMLSRHWADTGVRICLITLSTLDTDFFAPDRRLTRTSLAGLQDSHSLFTAIGHNIGRLVRLRRAIRRSGAGVVVSFVGVTNILTLLATTGLRLKVVISERNDPSRQSLGRPWDWLRRWTYPRASIVTANSRTAIQALRAYVPARKLAMVPNPVSVPAAGTSPGDRAPLILAVGSLSGQKAHDVLVNAFARVTKGCPEWRLSILGDGEERGALERLIAAHGLHGKAALPGRVRDVAPHYLEASVFAMPSRFEGMPNALLEAMSFGLPVVVSDACEGTFDLIEDGVSGLIVPAEDPVALANAIIRLVTDPDLRDRLGREAKRRIGQLDVDGALTIWDELLALDAPSAAP